MSGRILCVDDTGANLRLLTAVLEPHDFDVVIAEDGASALATIDDSIDLVLLDITMPGMNGYEVCRRIREKNETSRIPIVMITATGEEEKVRALEAGADDFIRRPFELPELLARVRSLLRIKTATDTIEGQAEELQAWNHTLEERVHEQLAELERLRTLERFLPKALADAVATGGDDILAPHRGEVAVVSIAITGFDEVAVQADPEDVVGLLSSFRASLGTALDVYQATVVGSTSDAVTAVVGDPMPADDPAAAAIALALDVREAMHAELERWCAQGHRVDVAAGVSIGHATVGLLGADGMHGYSAVGPVVVVAESLRGVSASGVRCDSRVRTVLAGRVDCRATGSLALPGLSPTEVFEVGGWHPIGPADEDEADVSIDVLGPIEVHVGRREIRISSARERSRLATLAAHGGQVVSVDALAEDLWEGAPPESAPAAIRVYVSRLRKTLQDAGIADLLETRPPGYRMTVEPGVLDVDRFQTAIAEAHQARIADPARAIERYRYALGLWRGRAYSEVADSPFGASMSARLHEARLAAIEECLALELVCGHHQTVVTDLEGLIPSHPIRERFRALAMIALAGLGRGIEASTVYDDYAATLQAELGASPSDALDALREAIARGESNGALLDRYPTGAIT